ncbi:TIM barrel protein, partial [Candidatus Peregrinibacteria bacterium]|nr:TIM barrel protein [Candidatus Peregrinibacteria bacterium]
MLALTTDSLKGHGLNRIFQITKEAGFDGVDLSIEPKNYDTQDENYIKKLSDQVGIPVLAISTPANSNEKKIKIAVKMAKKLDTKVIIIQPPKFFDYQYIRWLKKEVPLIRQKENISIALENAPSKSFLGIIPEHGMGNIMDLKKFKHACLDTARLGQKREDLIRVYKILKKYVVHIHLSNLKAGTPYAPLNKGLLPLESFLTKLKQDDFPGTI